MACITAKKNGAENNSAGNYNAGNYNAGKKETETMKTVFRLQLPSRISYFCGRRASPVAVEAQRRGNAAGIHGGKAKYGKRERRNSRLEERAARLHSSETS